MKILVPKPIRFSLIAGAVLVILVASLYLANFVANNTMAQDMVGQFGYLGVLLLAVVSGINILLPVPAATFTPVFLAAGLWLPFIILALVIGTTIADFIGYFVGHWSREFAEDHYPKTFSRIVSLNENHRRWLLPFVFLYAAVIPFPNEAMLIPLAVIGIRLKSLLIPLILGNIVNQSALALGATNIFMLIFESV